MIKLIERFLAICKLTGQFNSTQTLVSVSSSGSVRTGKPHGAFHRSSDEIRFLNKIVQVYMHTQLAQRVQLPGICSSPASRTWAQSCTGRKQNSIDVTMRKIANIRVGANRQQLRLDTYTCTDVDGERGTIVTETSEHGNPPPGHEPQHIFLPILLWKADVATHSQFMFDEVLRVLQRDAICCVEKETFVEGDAPVAGAVDTRRISFRGWMFAPCKQQYVSIFG